MTLANEGTSGHFSVSSLLYVHVISVSVFSNSYCCYKCYYFAVTIMEGPKQALEFLNVVYQYFYIVYANDLDTDALT